MPSHPRTTRPEAISWRMTSRAWLIGIENPIPWPAATIAVLMPITLPSRFRSGPPEFPGLIDASVWMKFSYVAADAVARRRRDDPDGHRAIEAEGVADRDRPLADAELVGVAELRDRQQRRRIHLEHGEVGLRIATHELRGELPPVREAHGDVLSVLDDVVVRQDVSFGIHDHARAARARVLARTPAEEALVELLAEEFPEPLRRLLGRLLA